jgi:hypothetical protein
MGASVAAPPQADKTMLAAIRSAIMAKSDLLFILNFSSFELVNNCAN